VPSVQEVLEGVRRNGRTRLLENEAKSVCSELGIPCATFRVARNIDDAVSSAEAIGYPVVLKIISPQVIHKSEVGGVVTDLRDAEDLRTSYNSILLNVRKQMPEAEITGVLVEEMLAPATEIVVGAARNPQFGFVIMFGIGGILVEVLKDVSFRAAPISRQDATEMISELKAHSILKGFRGVPPADIDALIEILLKVSSFVINNPEIKELDLNPILSSEKCTEVVDARISLGESGPRNEPGPVN